MKLNDLSTETKNYFRKLKGYDTLRLILCKCAILVEGDSDELVLQKAYINKYNRLPIQDGIDVISVGTAFLRFLELADKLNKKVCVITDNDGNVSALTKKYSKYNNNTNIEIFYDEFEYQGKLKGYNYNTLELCILRANNLETLNEVLNKIFDKEDEILEYMKDNKTKVAIKIFDTNLELDYPEYIKEAIE